METEKRIGKINSIRFGMGGYQDAMIGITIDLGGKAWGVSDFKGYWAMPRTPDCKWKAQDRINALGDMVMWVKDMLEEAHITDLDDLKGKPVEVTFVGQTLKSWRLLTEAL